MNVACPRGHGLPTDPAHAVQQPYYVRRCVHRDNRFVVEIRNARSGYIVVDYVEDLPSGDVLVQASDPNTEEMAEECWQALMVQMFAGEPPDPTVEGVDPRFVQHAEVR